MGPELDQADTKFYLLKNNSPLPSNSEKDKKKKCPNYGYCCYDKTVTKTKLGRKGFILSLNLESIIEKQGRS